MDKQREKMIELICTVNCEGGEDFLSCPERRNGHCRSIHKLEMCQLGAIADHLLANGVIVPPCKVGDVIYVISPLRGLEEKIVTGIEQSSTKILYIRCFGSAYPNCLIGKTVFLSREDAEKALKINTPTVNTID